METFLTIAGVVYIFILLFVGLLAKAVNITTDYYGDFESSIKELGIESFYYWLRILKEDNELTLFGIIVLGIIETLLIPADIILLAVCCIVDLTRLLIFKRR